MARKEDSHYGGPTLKKKKTKKKLVGGPPKSWLTQTHRYQTQKTQKSTEAAYNLCKGLQGEN